jgi:hypothetical protein
MTEIDIPFHMIQHPPTLHPQGNLTAWKTVGPVFLTKTIHETHYNNISIYPSHYFIPRHYSGIEYSGEGKIYAKQYWGTTPNSGFDY